MRTSPTAMMSPVMTLNGVSSFPFGFSSERKKRKALRSSCRIVTDRPGYGHFTIMVAM